MTRNTFKKEAIELIRRYGDTPLRRWALCADIEGLADFLEVDADDRKEELLAVRDVFGEELGAFRNTPLWILDMEQDDDALWEYRNREEAEEARAEQAAQGRWAEDEEDDAE